MTLSLLSQRLDICHFLVTRLSHRGWRSTALLQSRDRDAHRRAALSRSTLGYLDLGHRPILLIIGYIKPKAGILGGIILVVMFFTTSTMLITTPDDTIVVHGIHYMNNLGLFLFKDIISFGVAFYLISYYGRKAILAENQR
jgi:hypothetical protein